MYAGSFCDFVLRAHVGKFGALARELKQKRPLPKGWKRCSVCRPSSLERDWVAFVMENDSLKPKAR